MRGKKLLTLTKQSAKAMIMSEVWKSLNNLTVFLHRMKHKTYITTEISSHIASYN